MTLLCDATFMTPCKSDREEQASGCGEGDDGTAHRHMKVCFGAGGLFSLLPVVVAAGLYTCVKVYGIGHPHKKFLKK